MDKPGIQKVALGVIVDELQEQAHPERVEDVIYWALKEYSEREDGTWGKIIASSIIGRIDEETKEYQESNN